MRRRRTEISLGDEVCFDEPWRKYQSTAPTAAETEPSRISSPPIHDEHHSVDLHSNSSSWKIPHDWGLVERLHALVVQHQSLIDQLSIELAIERAARIALEEKVASLQSSTFTSHNRGKKWSEVVFEEHN